MFGNRVFRNEYEIIEGCRKGDRKAQRFLYDTYSKKFYTICLRYIKDRDLAEDVLVESFMKIFEKIGQFESKGSFEGWMKRVIVTHALLTLRSSKNLLMEVNLEPDHEYAQSSYELNHLEAEELMELVTSLPTGYRTVFNLYVIEGYSHAEIAELLGISESTSKSQLNRSRNLLKQKIAEQELKERRING
ncbi:RNA polymerase sigma factor [Belliella kenyensis]|uniref:RNA polymerase sigma factor n=1 Tax=Belliella kenyensis TaxID=1472724 RepID=A0ABV8EMK7_9BACT|nr:RNA polymerase sigma factor [Belliella kenyensis]MCH7403624.1 RNA polymerase sigma factor [Belliella kenyensis]MDN3603824.1 RNA polymerase sigma factor [Belliella kenyensis]